MDLGKVDLMEEVWHPVDKLKVRFNEGKVHVYEDHVK